MTFQGLRFHCNYTTTYRPVQCSHIDGQKKTQYASIERIYAGYLGSQAHRIRQHNVLSRSCYILSLLLHSYQGLRAHRSHERALIFLSLILTVGSWPIYRVPTTYQQQRQHSTRSIPFVRTLGRNRLRNSFFSGCCDLEVLLVSLG